MSAVDSYEFVQDEPIPEALSDLITQVTPQDAFSFHLPPARSVKSKVKSVQPASTDNAPISATDPIVETPSLLSENNPKVDTPHSHVHGLFVNEPEEVTAVPTPTTVRDVSEREEANAEQRLKPRRLQKSPRAREKRKSMLKDLGQEERKTEKGPKIFKRPFQWMQSLIRSCRTNNIHDLQEGLAPDVEVTEKASTSMPQDSPNSDSDKGKEKTEENKMPEPAVQLPGLRKRRSLTPPSEPLHTDTEHAAELIAATTSGGAKSPGVILPIEETGGVMSSDVMPIGRGTVSSTPIQSTPKQLTKESDIAETSTSEEEETESSEDEDEYPEPIPISSSGLGIPIGADGKPQPLLPPLLLSDNGKKCLVLDLDETLVHSNFKFTAQADFVVPVEIDEKFFHVYVIKRPGVDDFLTTMGKIYEIVVWTAALPKYANPVLDLLDSKRVVRHRLFRQACFHHNGTYIKDLSQLGRPISDVVIIDNSPASYVFHPINAVPVSSWFSDLHDTELSDLQPFLVDLADVDDARAVLDGGTK